MEKRTKAVILREISAVAIALLPAACGLMPHRADADGGSGALLWPYQRWLVRSALRGGVASVLPAEDVYDGKNCVLTGI